MGRFVVGFLGYIKFEIFQSNILEGTDIFIINIAIRNQEKL